MTTVAYAAVTRSGLSFDRQLWMRPEIVSGLRRRQPNAVHVEGAAASIQLGHCGNMSHKSILWLSARRSQQWVQSLFAHVCARASCR